MSAAAGCGGRGARAVLVLSLVACVLVPPQAGQADGRAATGDQWLPPATDWDLVDDALSVAEGSVAALGQRIEHLYEDIYIGLAMVVGKRLGRFLERRRSWSTWSTLSVEEWQIQIAGADS